MAEDTYYKLTRGSYTRWEGTVTPVPDGKGANVKEGAFVRYAADDGKSPNVIKNLSPEALETLEGRIQVTTAPRVKGATKEEEVDANLDAFLALNAPEAIEYVAESDDLPELKKLRAAEKNGKDRVSVIRALDERIDDLGGDLLG